MKEMKIRLETKAYEKKSLERVDIKRKKEKTGRPRPKIETGKNDSKIKPYMFLCLS